MEKKIYMSNAFSLQMVNAGDVIKTSPAFPEEIPENVVSCIGHSDTAVVLSSILGREVKVNRVSIHLEEGDVLYVAQLQGGRLPEGATTLPEGFAFTFIKVEVIGRTI